MYHLLGNIILKKVWNFLNFNTHTQNVKKSSPLIVRDTNKIFIGTINRQIKLPYLKLGIADIDKLSSTFSITLSLGRRCMVDQKTSGPP